MTQENENLIVSENEEGLRLDKYLSLKYPDQSRTYFQYLIESSLVLVNGIPSKKRLLVKTGDEIEIEFALTPEIALEAENIPLDIIYEDDDLLAINKPVGMVVHPAAGNWSGTFVNALLYYCQHNYQGTSLRPGIVHRLDKDTTGVLLAAKNEKTQQALIELFANRKIEKKYVAICIGNPGERTITGNIGRHPGDRKKMAIVASGGKEAITFTKTIKYDNKFAYVSLTPQTGRTHQLRVHLQSIGTPILGDPTYGSDFMNKKYDIHHQLLHAEQLTFTHPSTGQLLQIIAKIPQDLHDFIQKLN